MEKFRGINGDNAFSYTGSFPPPFFAGTRGMPAPSPCHPPHCRYLNDPEACAAFLARSVDSLPVDHEAGGELKVWMWDMKCGSGMAVQN